MKLDYMVFDRSNLELYVHVQHVNKQIYISKIYSVHKNE
jgi:hypothetical protein